MMLDQVVEALCEAEIQFVCVERIDEYSKVPPEVHFHTLPFPGLKSDKYKLQFNWVFKVF